MLCQLLNVGLEYGRVMLPVLFPGVPTCGSSLSDGGGGGADPHGRPAPHMLPLTTFIDFCAASSSALSFGIGGTSAASGVGGGAAPSSAPTVAPASNAPSFSFGGGVCRRSPQLNMCSHPPHEDIVAHPCYQRLLPCLQLEVDRHSAGPPC